ncbi:DNA polymerase Y family protein [Paraburkholderia sp. CNPSo 3076]|uniref:Y-family DNA polymerase n=1 Tax=Paraburkholderia sp. CNPSo 3076 TaxID=2940936 RepID=UPI00224D0686|nr:DNA polymerase Y family protein [Paraburkholderia sp. CNPSo 3076]MCX5545780.1 DNA polymerase Y family protein [Paraburkholderia sp. CNPSo 3076]
MHHWIGVHLRRLPIESFRPTWFMPVSNDGFVILDKGRVIDADAAARRHGVVDGMRRGGVLTLAQNAELREREPTREQQTIDDVSFALLQFTPNVVVAEENVVLADITASLRLFGGLRALRSRVRRVVCDFGVTCSASMAPTAEAAWLIARAGGGVALTERSLSRALSRISLDSLPAARRFADWFDGLGCVTIGDVMRLPRAGLKKRCGTALLDALDRATGEAPEVHEWVTMPPAFDARVELPDRIEHVEAALFAARRLTLQMTGWLAVRQLAVVRFVVSLEHERGRAAIPPTDVEVALGEPTWHEEHLVRLLRERLSRIELAAPVVALRLEAKDVRIAEAPSESLFPDPGGTPQDLARLMELLIARLGAGNVLRPAPAADFRPEVAAQWVPVGSSEKPSRMDPPRDLPRPAWLLETPIELIMRGHRPFYGSPLLMVSPGERIECGWQDGHIVTRDYFVAEAENSLYYWVYLERVGSRDERERRWFLHGLFG